MVNYNNVAKTVEPKRKKVAEAEKNLRIAQVRVTRLNYACIGCVACLSLLSFSLLCLYQVPLSTHSKRCVSVHVSVLLA